ncbi:MAG: cytochrome c [Gammaproteobacteria bacterium]|nr:cytochrome c [Gammaproteobacteria bacterium]
MKVFLLSLLMVFSWTLLALESDAIPSERQQELLHLLKQDCGSCHGLTMKGGLGPALLPENLQGKPAFFLAQTILDGRPGTAMPPWRGLINPTEASWLAQILLQGDPQ